MNIRVSSLPDYKDCGRRWFARNLRDIITEEYELLPYQLGVGAAIGTGVHAGASFCLGNATESHRATFNDMVDISVDSYRNEVRDGVLFDSVTGNSNDALISIQETCSVYFKQILPKINPEQVEISLKGKKGDFTISGHPDVFTKDKVTRDLKTGSVSRNYKAQMGGYGLLQTALEKSGLTEKPEQLIVDWIPRVRKTKPTPDPVHIIYDVEDCLQIAKYTIERIICDINRFFETGNLYVIPDNPGSILCSAKYCTAYKTKFCVATL